MQGDSTSFSSLLSLQPEQAEALCRLGMNALQMGKYAMAADLLRQAVIMRPECAEFRSALARAYEGIGAMDAAVDCYRMAQTLDPGNAQCCYQLGLALHLSGQEAEAAECYGKAISLDSTCFAAHTNLGILSHSQGDTTDAIGHLNKALEINGDYSLARLNLGVALQASGQLDEAARCYRQVLDTDPTSYEAHNNLANLLAETGDNAGAVTEYLKALELSPRYYLAHYNLGNVLKKMGDLDGAVAHYRECLLIEPAYHKACINLGNACKDMGEIEAARQYYQQAMALAPADPYPLSNLLLVNHYVTTCTSEELAQLHRCWGELYEKPLLPSIRTHTVDRSPSCRLRIGYLSPDFRAHPLASFIEPVLAGHDRGGFEVFCYYTGAGEDGTTLRLKGFADHWRSIAGLSDEAAAELIRQDGIHVLVDLAGHTADNRLQVFARKPAPVQVSWLGYPDTTGLAAIDYRFTDAVTDPPGCTEAWHTEQLVRLPDTFLCYRPPAEVPPINALPFSNHREFTFGCFNNVAKFSQPLLELWRDILGKVPQSRLLIKSGVLSATGGRQRLLSRFYAAGIPGERLELFGPTGSSYDHLACYNQVDLALDTFPYNGTTTTCEALLMGVPVVTLAGANHFSRVGASITTAIGLPDLAVSTPGEYVARAVSLAADVDYLSSLRQHLRQRLQHSPLMNEPLAVRNVELQYRLMWQQYCTRA